jgi:alcohol-forming fatty acyl-CoA reductase
MQQNEREIILAGANHQDSYTDLKWVLMQPMGNWAIRTLGFILRKAFRKGASQITFDQLSFKQAMAQVEPDHLVVLAPTHRSMMDFLVCSYLCFSHPELKISIPYIAADLQIGNLPFLGWFLKQAYAFYLKRGQGKPDPELNQTIRQLALDHQTLEIFIEGTRSRSRQCLPPKRGLLRALQQTGVPCTLLPIAINYDRVPEEDALLKELLGGPKPLLTVSALLKWCLQLLQGQVQIGRVHLVCAEPVLLDSQSDVHEVSLAVMRQLQQNYVVTTYHLRAFLHHHPVPGYNLESLTQAIQARGGTVLESDLDATGVNQLTEYSLRCQWLHLFFPDLLAHWPQHPVVQHHIQTHSFSRRFSRLETSREQNEQYMQLLQTLFLPLTQAYTALLQDASDQSGLKFSSPKAYVAQRPECFLPLIEEALTHLTDVKLLVKLPEQSGFELGPQWKSRANLYLHPFWEQDTFVPAPHSIASSPRR